MRAKKTEHRKQKSNPQTVIIHGLVKGKRVPSRLIEEQIQQAVRDGARELHIIADGQHGIGGRIWPRGEAIKITVEGPAGLSAAWQLGLKGHSVNLFFKNL